VFGEVDVFSVKMKGREGGREGGREREMLIKLTY
jgi:hypothetical protein